MPTTTTLNHDHDGDHVGDHDGDRDAFIARTRAYVETLLAGVLPHVPELACTLTPSGKLFFVVRVADEDFDDFYDSDVETACKKLVERFGDLRHDIDGAPFRVKLSLFNQTYRDLEFHPIDLLRDGPTHEVPRGTPSD
ncbi:hypothetical protein [Haliangium sp.]|uniref:hypothetical protein n=1 Tax=Haliangium sp. TaxID=2663208 RepID=UPI003D0BDD74